MRGLTWTEPCGTVPAQRCNHSVPRSRLDYFRELHPIKRAIATTELPIEAEQPRDEARVLAWLRRVACSS